MRIRKSIALSSLLFLGLLSFGQDRSINVLNHGVIADSNTLSTQAIQSLIDSLYFSGGGTLHFPPGDYKSGTIVLKQNVKIHLEEGATLYASRKLSDYRTPLENATRPVLIYANGAHNIGLEGKGRIHGNARHVYEDLRETDAFINEVTINARKAGVEMKRYYVVPPDVAMIVFSNCKNISITDVHLTESSYWTLHMVESQNIVIDGVTIYSSLEKGVNADGIDINSCQNVKISNCNVTTGDDAIVLKTRRTDPCENISVKNCIVSSSSSALKIGTESYGDFRNIEFIDCKVVNSNRGLSIVLRDGGTAENVLFKNIEVECRRRTFNWWGNGDPIYLLMDKRRPSSRVSSMQRIRFENIKASGQGSSVIRADSGMVLKEISMDSISFTMHAEEYPDKRASDALQIERAQDVVLSRISVRWDEEKTEPKWKSAIRMTSADGIIVRNFSGMPGQQHVAEAVIVLNDAQNVLIQDSGPTDYVSHFLHVHGSKSRAIVLERVDENERSEELWQLYPNVPKNAIEKR